MLRINLFSVSKFVDKRNTVIFEKNGAVVSNTNGETKLSADRLGDLYYIQIHTKHVQEIPLNLIYKFGTNLWHI